MADVPVHRFPPRYGARPRLGAVEVQEVQAEGRRLFALRARADATGTQLVLSPEALAVAALFDGERDLRAVQLAFLEQHQSLLYVEHVDSVARALFRAGLLAPLDRPAP